MTTAIEHNATLGLVLRWMEEKDLPDRADFINECAGHEDVVQESSLEEMTRWYHNPVNRERVILAYVDGKLVGENSYSRQDRADNAWGWMHVHPDYRLRGIGTAMYNAMERYIAEQDIPTPRYTPHEHAKLLIEFLERRGYTIERYFWDMLLPAEVEVPEDVNLPPGFHIRTFVHGQDEPVLLEARNASFAEHYGSTQRTLEEITALTKQPDFRGDGVFFAYEGDNLAGFCLSTVYEDECKRRGYGIGHIDLLGTMPAYRGRGIGRALLLTGVNHLRTRVPVVTLDVEGKNTNALKLYKNTGFHQHKGWANMVRGA